MSGTADEVLSLHRAAQRACSRAHTALSDHAEAVAKLSVAELRRLAILRGLKGVSKLHREHLVKAVSQVETPLPRGKPRAA